MENKTNFRGVWVPAEIFLDPGLSWAAKIVFSTVHAFESSGTCFMSNEYLGKLLGISSGQVSRYISELRERQFIEVVSFDGKTRVLRSLVNDPGYAKTARQHTQKPQGSIRKNAERVTAKTARQHTQKPQGSIRKNRKYITNTITNTINTKTDYSVFVDIYFKIYEEFFFTKPTFTAADGKKIKSIIKKLETKNKETSKPWDQDRAAVLLSHFLRVAASDKWIKDNYLLNILDSKFNAIINLKNKNNATKPGPVTPFDK